MSLSLLVMAYVRRKGEDKENEKYLVFLPIEWIIAVLDKAARMWLEEEYLKK